MIYSLNILVTIIATFLGVSLLSHLSFWGVVPLLSLFFIIGLTYFRKGFEPILAAAISGILLDWFSAYPFGLYLGIFLAATIAIRLLYQEGLKELSIISYLFLSFGSLTIIFFAQLVWFFYREVTINWPEIAVLFLRFMTVNLVYATFVYYFNNWYFEKIKYFENFQKRR